MGQIINIEHRRAGTDRQQLPYNVGLLLGEIAVTLCGIDPADFEHIRAELLRTARNLSHKSKGGHLK